MVIKEPEYELDVMFDEAAKLVLQTRKASSSLIQRRLMIGYARAARIMDQLEQNGVIGPANGAKPREILMPSMVGDAIVLPKKKKVPVKNEEDENKATWKKTKYANKKFEGIEIDIGVDKDNKKISLDLSKYENLLVIGNVFTGATDFLNNILATSLAKYSPDELRIIAMDGIRNDLIIPNKIPHALVPTIVEPEKGISALKWAMAEVERRANTFGDLGVRDIKEWNYNAGFQGMPNIMIVINALDQFLMFSPAEIEDNLYRLMTMGKKAGILFVMGVDPMVIKRYKSILSNNAAKLVFKMMDKSSAKTFNTPEAVELESSDKAILNFVFEKNRKIEIEKINHKEIYEEIFE